MSLKEIYNEAIGTAGDDIFNDFSHSLSLVLRTLDKSKTVNTFLSGSTLTNKKLQEILQEGGNQGNCIEILQEGGNQGNCIIEKYIKLFSENTQKFITTYLGDGIQGDMIIKVQSKSNYGPQAKNITISFTDAFNKIKTTNINTQEYGGLWSFKKILQELSKLHYLGLGLDEEKISDHDSYDSYLTKIIFINGDEKETHYPSKK